MPKSELYEDCNHDWECLSSTSYRTYWWCKWCGTVRIERPKAGDIGTLYYQYKYPVSRVKLEE